MFTTRASILRVCTNGVLSPIHIPCPTMQHFLSHPSQQSVTHDHLLTLVVHVAGHHRLLAILVHRCVHPSVALERDRRLRRAQLMQRPFSNAGDLTLTSRPSGVVSLNSTPGVKSYELVLSELSDRMVHLPAFSLTTSRGLMPLAVMRIIMPMPSSFMYSSKFSPSTYGHAEEEEDEERDERKEGKHEAYIVPSAFECVDAAVACHLGRFVTTKNNDKRYTGMNADSLTFYIVLVGEQIVER